MRHPLIAAFPLFALSASVATAAVTLSPSSVGRVSFFGPKSANTGTTSTTNSTSGLIAGDGVDNDVVHAGFINFDVSGATGDIAAASQILFKISVSAINGTPVDLRLVAIDTDGIAISGARSVYSGSSAGTISPLTLTVGDTISFDVTGFVQADAVAGTYSSFRLESVFEANDGDSTADYVQFGSVGTNDARLEIIPEPGSMLLAGLSCVVVALNRRRKG